MLYVLENGSPISVLLPSSGLKLTSAKGFRVCLVFKEKKASSLLLAIWLNKSQRNPMFIFKQTYAQTSSDDFVPVFTFRADRYHHFATFLL